jgi:hypothetical protein
MEEAIQLLADYCPSQLYYAYKLGFSQAVNYLQSQGLDSNARGRKYGTALQHNASFRENGSRNRRLLTSL